MLSNSPAMTVLPAVNVERARKFYSQTLGLREIAQEAESGAVIFEAGGGTRIELLPKDQLPKADHTALTFEVADVPREVKDLEQRGVRFEDYDSPGLRTEGHIAAIGGGKAAWFKDPDGNILCVHQRH